MLVLILCSLTSNSTPTTYLALVRVLTEPGLYEEIRAEVDAAEVSSRELGKLPSLITGGLPRLHAVFHETLRFHSDALSLREVLEETELTSKVDGQERVYLLKKGEFVNMPASLHHC